MGKKTQMMKEEKRSKKRIITIAICIVFVLFVIWVIILNVGTTYNYKLEKINGVDVYIMDNKRYVLSEEKTNLVKIDVKDKGIIIAELYPNKAPITVANFQKLVSEKFYDGLTFHRVISKFMIQTGDPTATGTGGSEETIKGEFKANGVENSITHVRGVLSMARADSQVDPVIGYNSGSSQFFIVQSDSEYLDGNYAGFGFVLHGMDIVDQISKVKTDENDKPLEDVIINNIRFVKEYEE